MTPPTPVPSDALALHRHLLDHIKEKGEQIYQTGMLDDALVAVVERHAPEFEDGTWIKVLYGDNGPPPLRIECGGCWHSVGNRSPWPCVDIRAITEALGIETPLS